MTISFRNAVLTLALSGALLAPMEGAALAQDVTGVWMRSTNDAKVNFSRCGDALCGRVAWVKNPERTKDVGLKVFYDMKPTGPGAWTGQAFNPEDGRTYSGKMVLAGNMLTTSGCALGGLICKSVVWSRSK